ncbi:pyruvate dehydrogenase E2 component (dihydrolipoamide acetyltransferase) [Kribbella sp. VKM Ac-2569]|uniref:dihydrolipoamide acetyltransferase family protein n=1 Tax=Kribbella sp. VKM Ac-2569 TaxID=2512220 RepID=UPI00102C1D06|nr:dihydrolipoamide acetyltransferase family protein [Kribbella sp. VKM Ac-2569]RZT12908.1 pyruvate dehydrogenase E2 component (dihydrolipoamide acetyltransferase) [Kribbella sp. VKM Ac-2569]
MGIQQFRLPDVGEGLVEAEIVSWKVKPGDTVKLNDTVVEIETAKSLVELPVPFAGVVTELLVPEGETVPVGTPIISVQTESSEASPEDLVPTIPEPEETGGRTAVLVGYGPKTTEAKRRQRKPSTPAADVLPPQAPAPAPVPAPVAAPVAGGNGSVHVLAKPPVRKLAKDLGIDLAAVTATGPGGVITRADVEGYAAEPAVADVPAYEPAPVVSGREDTRVPVKGVQKVMAQAMVASAFTAPHVTEWITVDVSATMELVERLKSDKAFKDLRVSPLLIVAKAVTLAARRTPIVNAAWDEQAQEIVYKGAVNLGIAAATPRGLIVPNIKGADSRTLPDLCKALNDLVATAREGKTQPADQAGGSFTITNVGVFGVDAGTPIINPGEAAILAFGAVRKQPWVVDDEIVPRWITTLALSFDHRLIDGEKGSTFLADVAGILEDPARALMF